MIWFNRLLLLAATCIMTMIALRTLRDPIGSTLPMGIVLTSPTAATVVRVGFGGFPLGFAVALFGCVVSTRRLLGGLFLLDRSRARRPSPGSRESCSMARRGTTSFSFDPKSHCAC